MTVFEYKEVPGDLDLDMLNREGLQGWEYVRTDERSIPYTYRLLENTPKAMVIVSYNLFKRERNIQN